MIPFGKAAVETIFTAFVVPALLLPLVWLGRELARHRGRAAVGAFDERFRRLSRAYYAVGVLLVVGGALTWAGVPVEHGGRPLTVLAWAAYFAANMLFAGIVVGMMSGYASLPEGRGKDSVFLRFVGEMSFQIVMTAGAFVLLFRLLRVVFHRTFPGTEVVTEGI